jgi:ESS family glutamate:Na+ symporter
MQFWDFEVWSFIVEFAVLLAGMMFANMLRRMIRPLRRSLIPSSVIGGFLVLGVSSLLRAFGVEVFQVFTLEILTYHGLGLGFVALALKTEERKKSKEANTDVFNTGITVVSTYLLHGVVGLAITLGLSYVIGMGRGPDRHTTGATSIKMRRTTHLSMVESASASASPRWDL